MTSFKKWSARRRCRYLHNTQQTQETNIHVLRGLKPHDPSNRAVANLRLRPHSHRDRLQILHFLTDFDVTLGNPSRNAWTIPDAQELSTDVWKNVFWYLKMNSSVNGCCMGVVSCAIQPTSRTVISSQSQQCRPKHTHCGPCSYSILFKLLSNPDIVPISFSPHFLALYRGWR
jgi:hypothetical protein